MTKIRQSETIDSSPMVRLARSFARDVPSRLGEKTSRRRGARRLLAHPRHDLRNVGPPIAVGEQHNPAAAVFTQDLVGTVRLLDLRDLPGRYPAGGGFQENIAKL